MISPQVIQELLTVRQVLHYLPASPKTEKGWTPQEQKLFWDALAKFPQGPWTTIAEFIGTKSTRQAMTHGQKLRQKLNRWRKRLRRTPAAALALAEDPELLDDDVKASIALSSVMMTSAAMTSAATPTPRNTSPIPTAAVPAMTAPMPTLPTSTSTLTTSASASSQRTLYVDDLAPVPHYYNTRASGKLPASASGYSLNATPTASSELTAADINYTDLLMASLPFGSTDISSFTSMPSATMSTSSAFDAMAMSMVSTMATMPSLPPSFVSMERHAADYHSYHHEYDYRQHEHEHEHRQHALQFRRPQPVRTTTTPAAAAAATAAPLYYADDEHYVLPQHMVDDLADVLWDY